MTKVSFDTTIDTNGINLSIVAQSLKMNRPTKRELNGKIEQAKQAVQNGNLEIVNPTVIASDAIKLGYQIKELKGVLNNLLNEVKIDNYAGYHPPHKSYEPQIKGKDLFAFRWTSSTLNFEIYLKFALKNETLYIVSLHENKKKKGGAK